MSFPVCKKVVFSDNNAVKKRDAILSPAMNGERRRTHTLAALV
jgi:hypothetical protein